MMRKLFFLMALCWACPAFADFAGRVVAVHDGDSLTLRVEGKNIRVRLNGIDAPEPGQRFAKSARSSLARICAGKEAKVVERGKDDRGRILGSVTCGGVDANGEQVRRGMAWVHSTYLPFGSPLYEFESHARLRETGLWRDKNPVPPWEWRKTAKK